MSFDTEVEGAIAADALGAAVFTAAAAAIAVGFTGSSTGAAVVRRDEGAAADDRAGALEVAPEADLTGGAFSDALIAAPEPRPNVELYSAPPFPRSLEPARSYPLLSGVASSKKTLKPLHEL